VQRGDRRLVRPKGDGACFRDGQLFRGLDFRGDVGSLLLLADNYNRATTGHHRGTERTEDAQRLFWQRFRGRLRLADSCWLWASRARQPLDRAASLPGSMAHARGSLPVGRAVRACCDVVRAGWIAWQALMSGGRGPVGLMSRVHAKAHRREVPMREGPFFRQSPRAAPVGPLAGKGHPGRQPSSARRARLPGKRSGTWAGRPVGPGVRGR